LGGDHSSEPQLHDNNPEEKGGLEELKIKSTTVLVMPCPRLFQSKSSCAVFQKNAGIGIVVYALE